MKPSLQNRLRVALAFSLITLLSLQWLVVTNTVNNLTKSYVASRLDHDAETLLGALDVAKDSPRLTHSHIDPIYSEPYSGHYFVVNVQDQHLRSRSLWDSDFPLFRVSQDLAYTTGPLDQWLLVKTNRYRKQGHDVTIIIAEDVSPTEEILEQFNFLYALFSAGALVLLLFLQSYLVKRSFKSLDNVAADVRRLEKGEIAQLDDAVPAEIYPVVKEFNRLLLILGQRLQRSRNALGNLAHALKTPLTVLTRLADQPEMQQHPDILRQLSQHTESIQRLMDRELKSARLAGAATPGAQFNCNEEIPKLIDTLQRIYQDKHISINYTIADKAIYPGDREDMIELLGNLLDNACKWAASRVNVRVEDATGIVIVIEDDGPGSPDDQIARVTERGTRLDESVAGHGLGLSIVKEIVHHYNGTIDFGRSPELGGFKVSIKLPGYEESI